MAKQSGNPGAHFLDDYAPAVRSERRNTNAGASSLSDLDRSVGNEQVRRPNRRSEAYRASGGGGSVMPEFARSRRQTQLLETAPVGGSIGTSAYESARERPDLAPVDAWYGSHGTAVERSLVASRSRSTAEMVAEVVIGDDDRVMIEDTFRSPFASICFLSIRAGDGRPYIGTGWLVGPRTVVTAGHCVYLRSSGGWAAQIDVFPACNGASRPAAFRASMFRSVSGWTEHGDAAYDYGAILLPESAAEFGALGCEYLNDDDPRLAEMVNVTGFPGDKPLGTMWGHARGLSEVRSRTLVYEIDTFGGNSGGPVFLRNPDGRSYTAIGIHNYGDLAGNSATRITPAVLQNVRTWVDEATS